jgi:hypothetical protein
MSVGNIWVAVGGFGSAVFVRETPASSIEDAAVGPPPEAVSAGVADTKIVIGSCPVEASAGGCPGRLQANTTRAASASPAKVNLRFIV